MSKEICLQKPREIVVSPLGAIKDADILDPDDIVTLESLAPELLHAKDTITMFRTTTEAICSVLDDIHHPTPASKYHQAKLEQYVMFECLVMNSLEWRELISKMKKEEAELIKLIKQRDVMLISNAEKEDIEIANAKIEIQQVKIDKLAFGLEKLRREAKDRLRELKMWSDIKETLRQIDSFDIDNKDTDQLIALTKRYCREALLIMNDPASTDIGSKINIIGQTVTLLRECIQRNLLDKAGPECIKTAILLKMVKPVQQQEASDSAQSSEPAQ